MRRETLVHLNCINLIFLENAGKTGQEAFIITKNDEVFACGPNYSHCLGLEKKGPQIEPIIVPQLCHKNVKGKLAVCYFEPSYFIKPLKPFLNLKQK